MTSAALEVAITEWKWKVTASAVLGVVIEELKWRIISLAVVKSGKD